ncbi:MAG: galactose mutarotase [Acidobacteriia bacterium]|nr:galactose mutarotase [Terriglobia bacterium]
MRKSLIGIIILSAFCAACFGGCTPAPQTQSPSQSQPQPTGDIGKESFGTKEGTQVDLYTLRNAKGLEAKITNYGGIVVSLKVPDRNGQFGDVVLGFDTLDGYLSPEFVKNNPYFGALIGRYGNRIGKARFTLAGKAYRLAANNGPNHLHGGVKGYDKVVWEARPLQGSEPALELRYLSKDGEEGYPGNLTITAVYTLTNDNALKVDFTASTDKETVVNLTHHSYFNLAGKGDILGHEVMIQADKITPVDSGLIPTGALQPVQGTPFDFNTPTTIGARIGENNEQLKFGKGYDHNWVINKPMGELGLMARVYEPTSGRVLEVLSTEPGLQFYSGNFLDGTLKGKGGWVYQFRNGFCMEPQHYPDSPNKPDFPSVVLKPGQTYKNTIIYRFSTK